MANPLYEALKPAAPMSPAQYVAQIKNNPVAFIRQAGYSIPEGITSPQQMIGYLIQSGQVPQGKLVQAQQIANSFLHR